MVRILIGIIIIAIGFNAQTNIAMYLLIGGCLMTSGLFDGGWDQIKSIGMKKNRKGFQKKKRRQEIEWKNRLERNEESKKLIQKFAKKMVERDIHRVRIHNQSIRFDQKELKFIDIHKKNLSEIGCKVMATEMKEILETEYNVKVEMQRKTKTVGSYYPEKEIFDGYELIRKAVMIEKPIQERTHDW